jgi:transposase-like protein
MTETAKTPATKNSASAEPAEAKKVRYSADQIQKVLADQKASGASNKQAGATVGASEATVRSWRRKFGDKTDKTPVVPPTEPASKPIKKMPRKATAPAVNVRLQAELAAARAENAALKALLKIYFQ